MLKYRKNQTIPLITTFNFILLSLAQIIKNPWKTLKIKHESKRDVFEIIKALRRVTMY